MDKISSRFSLVKERLKTISARMNELRKENQKLKDKNDELVSKMTVFEEEIKMAKKFVKEKEILKNRVEHIIENLERVRI
ncbi:MAG: hypothetical protein AB1349_06375 [Elusimicrobiota bacterium]